MALKVNIHLDENQNLWYIEPVGELDIYTSPDFKNKVLVKIEEENKNLMIDCSNLEYIDSTGLGALISIYKVVKEKDNQIQISNLKPNIKKLFDITDLDNIFLIKE